MSGTPHDAELEALLKALQTSRSDSTVALMRAPLVEAMQKESELLAALRDLKDGLARVAEGADDMIAEHPAASIGAAFLLGLAVGRLTRGI